MEKVLACVADTAPVVRQYAASTLGHASKQQVFSVMAPAAISRLKDVIDAQGEKHRRRRAVHADAKENALAVDACIRALGLICENQEQTLGASCGPVWALWLHNLPLRYDQDEGQKAHAQLLELVVRSHPVVASPENLPMVLKVFAEIYKTRFSNAVLDRELALAVGKAGEAARTFAQGLGDKQRKRIEQMLRDSQ